MRLVFAGTPAFAAQALAALHAAGHSIALVLTQPDRPAGRGLKNHRSAVAEWAEAHGLRVEKPLTLKQPDAHATIRAAQPEAIVVAAYGLLLPRAVLDIAPRGCLNIHASLLPRWRGAAPIQRALLAGDRETGISIMQMDAGLDTGPVLMQAPCPIDPRETAGTLTAKLAALGAEAICEALQKLDELRSVPQEEGRASYAPKVGKSEARLDWTLDAETLDRQVRAFNPVPGSETMFRGEILKVWEAEPIPGSGPPGTVLEAVPGAFRVACGRGALRLRVVQRAGGKRLDADLFLRGTPVQTGLELGQKTLASP